VLYRCAKLRGLVGNQQANDQPKEAKDGAEDLDHQDLDEPAYWSTPCPSRNTFRKGDVQRGIGSISKRSTTAIDANGDTTNEIAHADSQAGPEQGIASIVAVPRVGSLALQGVQLGREYDGHDDAVNGHDLAEDNRDKVLGTDTRGLDAAAQDRRAGDEDAPALS